jgi:RNA polymerase sigma-70 factor (ECF subfamily)
VDDFTVQAAQLGDRPAQARLLRWLQDPWYRLCLGLLGDVERAREATQETAARFLRQLTGFRGDSQLRTWALGIAINVAREMRRSPHARATALADWDEVGAGSLGASPRRAAPRPPPDVAAELAEQRDRLRAVLADLPERQREAVVLRFFEEMSVEDTALAMNCATGTVKATVHQALRSLRQKLNVLV